MIRGLPGGFLLLEKTLLLKFSTYSSINFLSGTALFRRNMKWARKALCVAIIDSPVEKKCFNWKCLVSTSPSYYCKWSYQAKNMKRLAKLSYHYHLPKVICTTHVRSEFYWWFIGGRLDKYTDFYFITLTDSVLSREPLEIARLIHRLTSTNLPWLIYSKSPLIYIILIISSTNVIRTCVIKTF